MKVLLSAYACEPGKGSEPGMGWHWAVEIARRGHEVHILTRANNVKAVQQGLGQVDGLRLFVHGYDLPAWARWWKKGLRGVHFYYLLWQWRAYRRARRLHAELRFDLVHHITFAVYRQPSFMGGLNIPFVLGPIGGAEHAPLVLLGSVPPRAKAVEFLRWAGNRLALCDPLLRGTFRKATLIFCKTEETQAALPRGARGKCARLQDVAAEAAMIATTPSAGSERPQFLFVGRLLYWKGAHLALAALRELRRETPDAVLTVVGDGRDRDWLYRQARELGVEEAVEWRGSLPREQVLSLYRCHTAFVFPSLHDSGGTVVMEAMSQGAPVVCLDLGGPGSMLPPDCGIKIDVHGLSESQVVLELARAMKQLATDRALRAQLSANALAAARRSTWAAVTGEAYEKIEEALAAR